MILCIFFPPGNTIFLPAIICNYFLFPEENISPKKQKMFQSQSAPLFPKTFLNCKNWGRLFDDFTVFYYWSVMNSCFLKLCPGIHAFNTPVSKYTHTRLITQFICDIVYAIVAQFKWFWQVQKTVIDKCRNKWWV